MKKLLNFLARNNIYLLIIALGLFATAFLLDKYVIRNTSINLYTRLIERDIIQKEKDFQKLASDTALIRSLVDQTYSEETLNNLLDQNKGYGIFVYEKTFASLPWLRFWNTQIVIPPMNLLDETDVSRFVSLSNGLYVYSSKTVRVSQYRELAVEALIPVLNKYFVEIENLKKEFAAYSDAGNHVEIVTTPTDHPVRSSYGNTLFYLGKASQDAQKETIWVILVVLTGLFLLFWYLHLVAHQISEKYGLGIGVFFLVGVLVLLRSATYVFPEILELRQFKLFDPGIYSSSFVLSSLGDLFINALLFCWVAMFINRRIDTGRFRQYQPPWLNWTVLVSVLSVLVVMTFVFARILQTLVADGQISFNVTYFYSLTQYSFIGFGVIATLALGYFLVSQILLKWAEQLSGGRTVIVYIITAFLGLMILSFTSNKVIVELNLFVLIWLMLYTWLMNRKVLQGLNFRLNISEVLFWLFVFSFSISAVIIFENRKIEFEQRKRFAEKLLTQADPNSERVISIALTDIDNDFLLENFQRFRDQTTNTALKDSIMKARFSEYLNKYDTKVFTFDGSAQPLFNDETISYDTLNAIYRILGRETLKSDLRYFERSYDKVSYILKKEVRSSDSVIVGYFFVLSDPKKYKGEALIPELFKQSRELVPEYSPLYSYAIYKKNELVDHYNEYGFPTSLSESDLPKTEFERRGRGSFEELWHRFSETVVVIARRDNSFIEAITLFAYLFSTFLFLLAVYRLISLIIRSRLRWAVVRQSMQLSIRSQIHSTILMVSILSFVVIGIATIVFFTKRYERNNQDRISRTIEIMVSDLQTKIKEHEEFNDGILLFEPGVNGEVEKLMQDISEIHGTDINLYDPQGNLRVSSNPFIYNNSKGVLSEQMNPMAFFYMNRKKAVQYVGEESMGKVNYKSIYSPVRDNEGRAYAFLNVPSYTTQGELKQEISNFIVTIINLNAFIFLIAGAIALFITNRITYSFTLIGQKMRDINLRKLNEEIEWRRDDEIGELVREYNKMVGKLEDSAEALAKSEREGAWRQMARQVAHEIKNPLTPMKLSIQYLQKAIDNNSVNVKEMTANVARTLVEQIDHLSKIASDFSQFANIGNPKKEVFDLHELLYSLTSLYEANDNMDFKWNRVGERVMIYADKTQLNRLFTNLMQNAVEASISRDQRIIRMDEELNGEFITISITDNGEGIPEHTQSKIFTPNFTTKTSGTGLGLPMSKSIVENAEGEIWFVTEVGVGTTFYVKLPLLRATL